MPRLRGTALAILLGGAALIATSAAFSLPDGFTFATIGDSIDVNTTRDGIIEGLQGYGYPFKGGNFAISGTEVIFKSQSNPYWDPLGAAGNGGDQFHFVSDLAIKPDVLIVGGAENSHSHNDTAANITNGYLSIIAAAKAIGCKVILRICSVTWGGVQLTNDRITKQIAVKAALMAAMAADPGNVLVIDTDSYDHGHVGWGIGPASGVFENGNSYADGTGHPNCAQGGPRLGKLIADAIIPYVVVGDTSRWVSSGTLLQNQNLNDKWNWPSFGAVSGTGYTGNAAAGLSLSNTGDVTATFAAGTVASGDVALVVSGSGTATTVGVVQIDVPIAALGAGFKGTRVYNSNLEVEIGNNAGTGDALGVYNMTTDLIVGGAFVATAYSGSTWNPSNLQQRNAVIRGYTALAVASDTTSATLRIKIYTDARALDYKIKLGRAFVRAPRSDPANLVINALPITNVYNSGLVTITVERGRTVGSVTLNWSSTDGSSGTITIPQGSTQGTATFTPLSLGSHTVTISGAAGSYTIGTATASFTNTDPSAAYIAGIETALGTTMDATEKGYIQTAFSTVAASGMLAHLKRWEFIAGHHSVQNNMNAMSPAELATITGGAWVADQGWTNDGVAGSGIAWSGWSSGISINSIGWGVHCNLQSATTGAKVHLGGTATAAKNIQNAHSGGQETANCNGSGAVNTRTGATRKGSRSAVRNNASTYRAYFNGSPVGDITQSSIVQNQSPVIGRNNTSVSDDRFAFYWEADGGATDAMVAAIYSAQNAYLTSKGVA